MSLAILRRHDLIRVDPKAWSSALAGRLDEQDDPLLADWAAQGWPLVMRRRDARDRPGRIPAGLPLPPARGKGRIRFDLAPDAIIAIEPPVPLADIRAIAPPMWRRTIEALIDLASGHAMDVRVYGSFAWSRLTGLDYVGDTSDLDLIWPLTPSIASVLAALPSIEAQAPGAIDGEIVRASDGGGANWRECLGDRDVLVKTIDAIALEPVGAFLGMVERR